MSTSDTISSPDLPPRTWRGWWREQPGWVHIGVWAIRLAVVLHVAVAVRILIGLQESPGITDLRFRTRSVHYFWEERPERFSYEHLLLAGMYGRDWASIGSIRWSEIATNAQLLETGKRCRRLKRLDLRSSRVSAKAIAGLGKCRSLEKLNLRDTAADDEAISQFGQLKRLTTLDLSGTLVTDRSLAVLKSLPQLNQVDVRFSAVSLQAIEDWRASVALPPVIDSNQIHFPNTISGSLRWSDGERSANIDRVFKICADGPLASPQRGQECRSWGKFSPYAFWMRSVRTMMPGDGDYRLWIQLGEYESAPAAVMIQDGKASTRSIIFQMPCTKAEALKSAKVE